MGRVNRTKDATDTITRNVFDALGRPVSRWVGTDDTHGWTSGSGNGSSGGSDNMTQVELTEYDSGGVGNSYVTKVAPRSGNGPWVVRVEVSDDFGDQVGRDFLELGGG